MAYKVFHGVEFEEDDEVCEQTAFELSNNRGEDEEDE